MTREDIKIIIDIVHKTIYGFFDVCGDDEETPMTDKDKLLLKVNKAICNNIKALEQEPNCPYYVIDEDGHGLCKNHRLEQEPCGETVSLEAFKQVIWKRNIAIEQLNELGYDFGQKIEPCDYTISHDAVLQAVSEGCQELRGVYGRCEELINNLPPISQPCGDVINRQAVIDIIHKTIYDFFDVCGDDEEVPISDKDKLLLKVNKAICNNIKALEQEPNCPYYVIDEDGHGLCKNHRLEQEQSGDLISRQAVQDYIAKYLSQYLYNDVREAVEVIDEYIGELPSVNPQEPKTGHCKDCKWWKDSDGVFRRGIGAESQCPMNRKEVYEGNGYCYMFELQESDNCN